METYLDRIKRLKAERMSDSPKLNNVMAICNALGCTVEYIVDGTPENTNNYTLNKQEIRFMEDFRKLDMFGKSMIETILKKELERVGVGPSQALAKEEKEQSAKILEEGVLLNRYAGEKKPVTGRRDIPLYDLPVSAGVGEYLEDTSTETIKIPNTVRTLDVDYALLVNGSSMEPNYSDGDVLLVQTADTVAPGELGIFLLDGSGFFKKYDGDRLLSLNPKYAPIMLKDFCDIQCRGRVIGRLKRRNR